MKAIQLFHGSLMLLLIGASAAMAQNQRSFVSGLGNDANPCSRTAPCRTFGQAISQTNAGGEVYALDTAGYGPFIINKAVSIIAQGVTAGITVSSGDGIVINVSSSDTVILRGLTLNSLGSGARGIHFVAGGTLHVESCVASGFQGQGIEFAGPGQLEVKDSIMRGNNGGILVDSPTGVDLVALDQVRLEGNVAGLTVFAGSQVTVHNSIATGNGIGIEVSSSITAPIQVNLDRCAFSNNSTGVFIATESSGPAEVNIESCVISGNSVNGIQASSDSTGISTVRISNSTVTNNPFGIFNNGSTAVILSRGNNTIEGNTTNTSGTFGSYTAK